jgi:hypothetical protein
MRGRAPPAEDVRLRVRPSRRLIHHLLRRHRSLPASHVRAQSQKLPQPKVR